MKLQLHKSYPGESWTGAIGDLRFDLVKGSPVETDDEAVAAWLLTHTWRDRQRDEAGSMQQEDKPVFEVVTEESKQARKSSKPVTSDAPTETAA